jgi:hypothetical protein
VELPTNYESFIPPANHSDTVRKPLANNANSALKMFFYVTESHIFTKAEASSSQIFPQIETIV